MAVYEYENKKGVRIEREFPMAGKIPKHVKHKGARYERVMSIPSLGVNVGKTGRKGHDGYFVARSLPPDPGNTKGIYPRVNKHGQPMFASRSERDRSTLKLQREGLDIHYNEKPEVKVDCAKGEEEKNTPYAGLRTKLGNAIAAGKHV